MKIRRLLSILFVILLALVLVACGESNDSGNTGGNTDKPEQKEEADPLVPTGVTIKVRTAKVQINNELKLTYNITPATAQGDAVKVTVNNDLATVAKEGNKTIVLTAGSQEGSVRVTVETSNGIKASKTIKIQIEEVQSYPDLSGYTIKVGQAVQALGEYDPRLTMDTADQYGYYAGQDREFRIQAWEEIEENYNCQMDVVAYPSDAPWGPARWNYILTQAQNESPEYDFYVVETSTIPGFVSGNAIQDLTEWYAEYGKNCMNDMAITSSSYKQRLYAICTNDIKVENILGYNYNLFKALQDVNPNLIEPAQMYLDGNWNYDTFKTFVEEAQQTLNTLYSTSEDKYYALSGYGSYYWQSMVNAAGIKVLDTTQLVANITGSTETLAAEVLRDLYAEGCMDPNFQIDGGVSTWNNGHSLFNTGGFWFLNHNERWSKDLWGADTTAYGWVPFPTAPDSEHTYIGTIADGFLVMAANRDWAYAGFGDECTAENIYRAFIEYHINAKTYYTGSEDYDYESDLRALALSKFGSEASVKAYMQVIMGKEQEDGTYIDGLTELGFFDPFVCDNNVANAYGATGTFGGDINAYIKGGFNDWVDAVGGYQSTIDRSLVDVFG